MKPKSSKSSEEKFLDNTRVPTLKDFLLVILAVAILVIFSWLAYYKFHWLN